MSYVIAAYGVTLLTLVLYGGNLARERRALAAARKTAAAAGDSR